MDSCQVAHEYEPCAKKRSLRTIIKFIGTKYLLTCSFHHLFYINCFGCTLSPFRNGKVWFRTRFSVTLALASLIPFLTLLTVQKCSPTSFLVPLNFFSKGRKSGAVMRIALRNFSWAGRIACRRPSSSGTPRISWARSLVNVWRREEISPRGSSEGGLGKPSRRSRARIMDFSSSSWISGSLWNDKKKIKKLVRMGGRDRWETSSKSSPIRCSLIYPRDWKSLDTFDRLRQAQTMVASSQKNPVPFV